MNSSSHSESAAAGDAGSLARIGAGALAGSVLGLVDGALAARNGAWEGALGLLGCLTGAMALYALLAGLTALVLGWVLDRILSARDQATRLRLTLTVVLGVGLFLEIYWWTRPLVYYGIPATDPRRLAAAGAMALVGLGLAWYAAPLLVRARAWGGHACALLLALVWIGGGAFVLNGTLGGTDLGRINERNRDLPNVVLFVVDALRDDVLEPYGSQEVETPNLVRLAAQGVTFENALVQAPFTWSSFGSILTGKYPRRHGLVKMMPGVRMRANVTFPQHLKQAQRLDGGEALTEDRKSTRLNSSHVVLSYAVLCLKKKTII